MDDKDRIIADLRALVASLLVEIESLKLELAKAKKDSSTSSKSPSSDIVKPPKKKTGRRKKPKQGGQQGHKRKLREPLPPERVNESFVYEIDDAEVRDRGLTATDEFEIIQHIELLDLPVHVTEHQLRKYFDGDGNTVLPNVPELQGPIFGPRMLAMIGWLKSRAHCSYSTVALWMSDVLQVPVSRGYLAKLCNGTISASLSDAHEELKQAIPQQPQLGSDESSLKNCGKKTGFGALPHRCLLCFTSQQLVLAACWKNSSQKTTMALLVLITSRRIVLSPGTLTSRLSIAGLI